MPSTDVIQLTLTLKMTTAQVVETSVTVNSVNNSAIQNYVYSDDDAEPTYFREWRVSRDGRKISQYWTGGRVLNKHAQIPDTIVIVVPF